jgi:predicted nucleic acid-binding protein
LKRFVLDPQIYIDALRSADGAAALRRLDDMSDVTWLSAIVAHELISGAPHRDETGEHELLRPLIERGLLVTPSLEAWQRSAGAIAALHARRRIVARRVTKSFANDLLLAASCAEENITLVTRNARDFALIAEEIPFRFIPPWR